MMIRSIENTGGASALQRLLVIAIFCGIWLLFALGMWWWVTRKKRQARRRMPRKALTEYRRKHWRWLRRRLKKALKE